MRFRCHKATLVKSVRRVKQHLPISQQSIHVYETTKAYCMSLVTIPYLIPLVTSSSKQHCSFWMTASTMLNLHLFFFKFTACYVARSIFQFLYQICYLWYSVTGLFITVFFAVVVSLFTSESHNLYFQVWNEMNINNR